MPAPPKPEEKTREIAALSSGVNINLELLLHAVADPEISGWGSESLFWEKTRNSNMVTIDSTYAMNNDTTIHFS